ncbi:thioredoxin domain-containing protein [Falsiroseomonas tokyonensis]|uniref:Thioredoxin domain-containing protein n=1 Tax=Falsiroseomonas tokyonensis TaxID=430521 RepID=A0ABV7BW84_9PROT|nr:thioredoxin domain-containing protein [Falsiroseomonas tokyonensis]MBU8539247.1 thioredoxin domain-containing protein [Falsiroseomonas tokyonensis]
MLDRRSVLTLAAGFAPGLALAQGAAPAQPAPPPLAADDPRMAERSVGRADAPVTVIEYFSLTCGHCAAFHRETYPKVKSDLIESGRMRLVFRDFPLDGLALAAAAVARSLPPERYEPFISTLLSTQDRWAFARGGDPREELFKVAALAGMSRAKYDEVLADQSLARAILAARVAGQQEHNVSATPTFVFGNRPVSGAIAFPRFAALVAETR